MVCNADDKPCNASNCLDDNAHPVSTSFDLSCLDRVPSAIQHLLVIVFVF